MFAVNSTYVDRVHVTLYLHMINAMHARIHTCQMTKRLDSPRDLLNIKRSRSLSHFNFAAFFGALLAGLAVPWALGYHQTVSATEPSVLK